MQTFTIPGNDALMSIITEFYPIMVIKSLFSTHILIKNTDNVNFDKTPTLFSTHVRKKRCLFQIKTQYKKVITLH